MTGPCALSQRSLTRNYFYVRSQTGVVGSMAGFLAANLKGIGEGLSSSSSPSNHLQ